MADDEDDGAFANDDGEMSNGNQRDTESDDSSAGGEDSRPHIRQERGLPPGFGMGYLRGMREENAKLAAEEEAQRSANKGNESSDSSEQFFYGA